jgi:hypothetical protein
MLKSTGESTEPYGKPISATREEVPTSMIEFRCNFSINPTS